MIRVIPGASECTTLEAIVQVDAFILSLRDGLALFDLCCWEMWQHLDWQRRALEDDDDPEPPDGGRMIRWFDWRFLAPFSFQIFSPCYTQFVA